MAILNDWQKLTRVVSGKPFGDGSDGAYSSATIPTLTKDSCSGAATSTTLTTTGSTFANGDVLLIHQTRGTGVGQWEINKVASGGGSTSLTLQEALYYTYTDSGASQAQAIKVVQYTDVTVQTGTWTIPAWDGNTGGILVLASNGTFTQTGGMNGDGSASSANAGGASTAAGGTGKGFSGGVGRAGTVTTANQGEGTSGAGSQSTTANGSGGGGGNSDGGTGGGGGANATNGADGTGGVTVGAGGTASGSADLTTITFGGGGGGAQRNSTSAGEYSGGAGGGAIMIIFAKDIQASGVASFDGGASAAAFWPGGGGAGGSILLVCQTATLDTNKFTASAGTGTDEGGDPSVGRIAVHHSGTVTGTTTPTFTDVEDSSLIESGTSGFFAIL